MSDYTPQKGDRVRVVIEGEVRYIGARGFSVGVGVEEGNHIIATAPHVVSVERLAPKLPTTPGSVIKVGAAHLWCLAATGLWFSQDSVNARPNVFNEDRVEVIHDAGASS